MTTPVSRICGDIASMNLPAAFRFNQEALRGISSEARFADGDFQFRILFRNGLWYIQGNPQARNLTVVNRKALPTGVVSLKSGDKIELVGRESGRYAMCLRVELVGVPSVRPAHDVEKAGSGGIARHPAEASHVKPLNVFSLVVGLSADEVELQNIVARGWMSFSREIDITSFVRRTHWKPERILTCARGAYLNHPEIFHFSRVIKVVQSLRADGYLAKVSLTDVKYEIAASEYSVHKRKLDEAAAAAMACIKGVSDKVEKALRLHDYLIRTCEYDLAGKDKDDSCVSRTAYSALVRRKAVCEGYTMAYRLLLNMAGIVSDVAESDSINHIWNYVRINGKWYHVDVTFDDPVYIGGAPTGDKISHKHFLMSDKKATATGHKEWNVRGLPAADDERFDNRYN